MKNIWLLSVVFLLFTIKGYSETSTVQMLIPGRPLYDNKVPKSTGGWWGIWGEDPKVLRKTQIDIQKGEHGYLEVRVDCEKQISMNCDSIQETLEPSFLMGNLDWAKQAKIISASFDSQNDEETTLKYAGSTSILRGLEEDGKYLLYFIDGQKKQIIYSNSYPDGFKRGTSLWTVMWAGDIDQDQKVDFLIFTGTDNDGEFDWMTNRLFLSSYAKNDELVRQVATFVESPGD